MSEVGTVYLIHFGRPYHHARHYLGWARDVDKRFAQHVSGKGSPLVKAVVDAGIRVSVVKTWPGETRNFERRLKKLKNTPRFCPICRGGAT